VSKNDLDDKNVLLATVQAQAVSSASMFFASVAPPTVAEIANNVCSKNSCGLLLVFVSVNRLEKIITTLLSFVSF
jgi:hypothetical protein